MRIFLALVLLTLPAQAAEPLKLEVMCYQGWCRINQETLKELLTSMNKLAVHTAELRALCGWEPIK